MTNLFSQPKYLEVIAKSLFPEKKHSLVTFSCENKKFQTFAVQGDKPVTTWPFMDFFEAIERGEEGSRLHLKSVPRVMVDDVSVNDWSEKYKGNNVYMASPYVQWKDVTDKESYIKYCKSTGKRAFSKRILSKKKKITAEIGEYKFVSKVDKETAKKYLDLLMAWKSAQYQKSGYQDMFSLQKYRDMFFNLLDADLLIVSALEAGSTVLALHAGHLYEGRFYYVLPAYDTSYTKYSAGTLLFEELILDSFERGDKEFDLLLGDEEYKFSYANRVRVIQKLGIDFWIDKVWLPIRQRIMRYVSRIEFIYMPLKNIKRTLQEKGWF